MLVSKGYSKDDVVSFKLVNGDECIARIVSDDIDKFVVSRPCMIVPSAQGVGLMQAMLSVDPVKDFPLMKTHVMLHGPTEGQLSSHYMQVTTGIAMPNTKQSLIV